MGVFAKDNSKFWWMYLELTKKKERTDILVGITTAQRKKESRALAEAVYEARMLELGRHRHGLDQKTDATTSPAFLWQRIEKALRAHGPLDLAGLKAHIARFVKQKTPRRIDAVILTELRRRPALFRLTPKGFVVRGPVALVQQAATCAHCGGPMPALTPRRQSAPWRATHCRRWCARAAAMATAKPA